VPDPAVAPVCPSCRRAAPIVLRGLESRCAACGASRFLLSAPSVSLAGQPSRVGGLAASIVGWGILLFGTSLAAALWLLAQSIWPGAMVGWALAIPVSAAALFFGLLFLLGGKRLRQQGTARQQEVQRSAVRALVEHRKGAISAHEVASKLQLPEAEADALLSALAREKATAVTVDIDDGGHVTYDFSGQDKRWRVLEDSLEEQELAEAEAAHQRRTSSK
jgi:hypothetical protein